MINAYTLDEDLYALFALVPTPNTEKQLGRFLHLIQEAASREEQCKWIEQVNGYMQALSDLELLNAEQATLLRELVMRANFRSALNS